MIEKEIKTISSVSEYLSIVEQIQRDPGRRLTMRPVLYRGETRRYDEIYASLFRDDIDAKKGTSRFRFKNIYEESLLYQNAERMFPSIFKECRNALDKMVKMQHYGLPTRLLDVTENPLVALYFACADYSTSGNDGRILCEKDLDYADSNEFETIRMLANFVYHNDLSMFYLPELDEVLQIKDAKGDKNFVYERFKYYLTTTFLIKPPALNERIRAQQGAILFSSIVQPGGVYDNDLSEKIQSGEIDRENIRKILLKKNPEPLKDLFEEICVIPVEKKESIINELDDLGVNMAALFPDEEHQMRYVYDKYVRGKKTGRWSVAKIDNL